MGVPHGVKRAPVSAIFGRNLSLSGGIAPVRRYIPELLQAVLNAELDPSPVFDVTMPLDQVADAYRLMNERRALKIMLTV